MRTVTTTTTLYTFNELSEEAQDHVIASNYAWLVDCTYWHEDIIESFENDIAPLFGLSIGETYFRGFCSQGDGACFTGSFQYNKGMVQKVKDYAPMDKELHKIAENLAYTQRKAFYNLHGDITHRGHYYHSGCTDFNTYRGEAYANGVEEDAISYLYRDLMNWLYSRLESEYDYLTSETTLREWFADGDYEFDEDGEIQ